MKRLLIYFFTFFCIFPLFSEEINSGIIYGDNWACLTIAPEGWIMDQESMAHNNIYALFYERGKKFKFPTPIIYMNTTKLRAATDEALQEFIDYAIQRFSRPGTEISILEKNFPKLNAIYKMKYHVYSIINDRGQFEIIIYMRYKDTCFFLVLNAPTKETLNELYPKMEEIIDNIAFLDKY